MIADDDGNEVRVALLAKYWSGASTSWWSTGIVREATAETIKGGWLHTGDVAIMDDEGFVSIQDRIKDMIISGGENVYPAEIEGVLAIPIPVFVKLRSSVKKANAGVNPLGNCRA